MAFETHLIAISWIAGKYEVVSQVSAPIDTKALARDGLLHDASNSHAYIDEAAVVHRTHLDRYIVAGTDDGAAKWLAQLPSNVTFILVHVAEWESGFAYS